MQKSIKIQIETLSNLFIGGVPVPFEIGGIDQRTAIDQEGFPCIPGSSLKGALRAIVHEDKSEMGKEISKLFTVYLQKEKENNWKQIQALVSEKEALERIQTRYEEAEKQVSPAYLFGIHGFNNTPKLLFSDLLLLDKSCCTTSCFSIDMKNSIDSSGAAPVSNPRTYQTARQELVFEGEIFFSKMQLLGEQAAALCEKYIKDNLLKFNDGFYRLGNSKSRGYGKVKVCVTA